MSCDGTNHSRPGAETDRTVALLEEASIQISMAAVGKPTENAYVERLMRTLKEEEVFLHEYRNIDDARAHLAQLPEQVSMYKRVHSALGYVPRLSLKLNGSLRLRASRLNR